MQRFLSDVAHTTDAMLACVSYTRTDIAMQKHPAVYIVTNHYLGTLYVGVTSNLPQRVWQHRNAVVPSFTTDYGLNRLVWYEVHDRMYEAITREKQLKRWNRQWKIDLINAVNPEWRDLWDEICG
jgi:putative endonuclease